MVLPLSYSIRALFLEPKLDHGKCFVRFHFFGRTNSKCSIQFAALGISLCNWPQKTHPNSDGNILGFSRAASLQQNVVRSFATFECLCSEYFTFLSCTVIICILDLRKMLYHKLNCCILNLHELKVNFELLQKLYYFLF